MQRVLGALTFALVLLGARPSQACSCAGLTQDEAFAEADVVFRGRALGDSPNPFYWVRSLLTGPVFEPRSHIVFSVSGVWKGTVSPHVVVSTGSTGIGGCGAHFESGQEYVVFAKGRELRTSMCSENFDVRYGNAARLGPARPPSASLPVWAMLLGSLGSVTLLVLAARKWRRRAQNQPQTPF